MKHAPRWGLVFDPTIITGLKLFNNTKKEAAEQQFSATFDGTLWPRLNDESSQALTQALAKLPHKWRWRHEKVAIALNDNVLTDIHIKIETLYFNPSKNPESQIAEALSPHLIKDVSAYYWDYLILSSKSNSTFDFHVVLIEKIILEPIIKVFVAAKLELSHVYVKSHLLSHAPPHNSQADKSPPPNEPSLLRLLSQCPFSTFNLVPWRQKSAFQRGTIFSLVFTFVLIVSMSLCSVIGYYQAQHASHLQRVLAVMKAKKSKIMVQINVQLSKNKESLITLTRLKWFSQLCQQNVMLLQKIIWVTQHWPALLLLKKLSYHQTFTFTGYTHTPSAVNAFMAKLSQQKILSHPTLTLQKASVASLGQRFDLTFRFPRHAQ